MARKGTEGKGRRVVVALSGGPDSVYLLYKALEQGYDVVAAHLDHGARGAESEEDARFVQRTGARLGVPVVLGRAQGLQAAGAGFEERARRARYRFLQAVKDRVGADEILVGHTADDQVETILMRVFRGGGLAGLKGIPARTHDGVARPLLSTWRAQIVDDLRRRGVEYREDSSNAEIRYERNWIRHVVIPLLVSRYGSEVRRRLLGLGKRLAEVDEYLDRQAAAWIARRARPPAPDGILFRFQRPAFVRLPALLRARILARLCLERAGKQPSERLLASMDRLVLDGGPSGAVAVARRVVVERRYDEVVGRTVSCEGRRPCPMLLPSRAPKGACVEIPGPGRYRLWDGRTLSLQSCRAPSPEALRSAARGEEVAYFDPERIAWPVRARPLCHGDRVTPFGARGPKRLKEIMIERKIPRAERWGRVAVCDAEERILWVPGVVRAAWGAVPPGAKRALRLGVGRSGPLRQRP